MKTKEEMIEIIKAENPKLQIGDDENGYTQLSQADYNKTITDWANARFSKITLANAKAQAKSNLLVKLGITEDEAKLLLS